MLIFALSRKESAISNKNTKEHETSIFLSGRNLPATRPQHRAIRQNAAQHLKNGRCSRHRPALQKTSWLQSSGKSRAPADPEGFPAGKIHRQHSYCHIRGLIRLRRRQRLPTTAGCRCHRLRDADSRVRRPHQQHRCRRWRVRCVRVQDPGRCQRNHCGREMALFQRIRIH